MKRIKLEPLYLEGPTIPSGSALINIEDRIFVCCDDMYSLFELLPDKKLIQHKWPEAPALPVDHKELKKVKPDFEALLDLGENKLLLIPSGSKANRTKALKFDLLNHQFAVFDMKIFFGNITEKLSLVNLEGAAAFKGDYLFLNRGALADLSSFLIVDQESFKIKSMVTVDFGEMKGIPLHGSELCIFEDSIFAIAVAEATDNSYDDGEIVGSSLFQICSKTFSIIERWEFDRPVKIEGLCRLQNHWLVVTDPDNVGESEFFTFIIN